MGRSGYRKQDISSGWPKLQNNRRPFSLEKFKYRGHRSIRSHAPFQTETISYCSHGNVAMAQPVLDLPECVVWTKEEVAKWIEDIGYKQYKVRKRIGWTIKRIGG